MNIENLDSALDFGVNIDAIRNKLYTVVNKPLGVVGNVTLSDGGTMDSNAPIFENPKAFAMYKSTGGKPLGTNLGQFVPLDLNFILDSLVTSVLECGNSKLDLSKLEFEEFNQGGKAVFSLPLPLREIKTPMIGDVVKVKLLLIVGFDGKTTTKLTLSTFRLWCLNGCTNKSDAIGLSFRNTKSAKGKVMSFCNQIEKSFSKMDSHFETLERLVEVPLMNQEEQNAFIEKVTGYFPHTDNSTKCNNILDRINEAISQEVQNTGANYFSLVQGLTRYTSHDLNKDSDFASTLFNPTITKINNNAFNTALLQLN